MLYHRIDEIDFIYSDVIWCNILYILYNSVLKSEYFGNNNSLIYNIRWVKVIIIYRLENMVKMKSKDV